MALYDFTDERRLVYVAGRRFVVRKPSLGAVVLLARLFARELADGFSDTVWENDPRVLRLLPMAVDGDGDPATWPVTELLAVIQGMTDVARIRDFLLPSEPRDGDGDILKLAAAIGVDAVRLMDWPCEAVISACEILRGESSSDNWYVGGIAGGEVMQAGAEA